jgi:hypothetical protein
MCSERPSTAPGGRIDTERREPARAVADMESNKDLR